MVHLIVTQAPLLSGSLRNCAQIDNLNRPDEVPLDDSSCSSGGLAAVQALNLMYSNKTISSSTEAAEEEGPSTTLTPTLVIPMGDFKSPLTTMSRFHFGVNTMIFGAGELGFRTWTLPAYTLHVDRFEEFTLYDALDPNFPAVLSNVVTSPAELGHLYIRSIHWDEETHLAVIYLTKEYLINTHSQRLTTQRLLQYIYKRNRANGCLPREEDESSESSLSSAYSVPRSGYSAFSSSSQSFSDWFANHPDPNRNVTFPPPEVDQPDNCYLPVIIFDDKDQSQYDLLVESLRQPFQPEVGGGAPTLRPHLLVDLYGHAIRSSLDDDPTAAETISIRRTTDFESFSSGATATSTSSSSTGPTTWVVSYEWSETNYHQLDLSIASDQKSIDNVQIIYHDLTEELPLEAKTPEYDRILDRLRQYAREALQSSLLNEPGVLTTSMPEMTSPSDGFRRCYVGECELGNLVADAMRWAEDADVALLPSFIFDGPGWNAGEIRTLELLENVPYTAPRCNATLTGNSLLRLLQHSIATSSFGPYDDVQDGGRFLQVSGLRMVYNNELNPNVTGNIISLDIWDRDEQEYLPVNRTRLYTLASGMHLCFTFSDFPDYLGSLLVEEGEEMAVAHTDSEIKMDIKNYLMANFYDPGETYQPRLEGRIQADWSATDALFVCEAYKCLPGETFWSSSILDCTPCPTYEMVQFSDDRAQLLGLAYAREVLNHEMWLTNGEQFSIEVTPEALALPDNIQLNLHLSSGDIMARNKSGSVTGDDVYILEPTESVMFHVVFDPSDRNPGTDTSSLVFGVKEVNRSGLCQPIKLQYEIEARLSLSRESNNLNNVAYFGYTAAAVIILTSLFLAAWVHWRRRTRVVSAMQPFFLVSLCFGVLLMGTSLIPLSIDDGVTQTQQGINMVCMARPWLLVLGFSISVAALFSKLYRINKLFSSEQFRRIKVRERDVLWPTGILIVLNVMLLLVWTVRDPLEWNRVQVPGQPWNTYGTCQLGGGEEGQVLVGKAMLACIVSLCALSFLLTCWQAFQARNISSEFSESKYLGIAVFSWVQLLLVGGPVLFLVDDDNVVARYSLIVGLLIAVCLSMLLVVFVPILAHKQREENLRNNVMMLVNNTTTRNNNHQNGGAFQSDSPSDELSNSIRISSAREALMMKSSSVKSNGAGGNGDQFLPNSAELTSPTQSRRSSFRRTSGSDKALHSIAIRLPRIEDSSNHVLEGSPSPTDGENDDDNDNMMGGGSLVFRSISEGEEDDDSPHHPSFVVGQQSPASDQKDKRSLLSEECHSIAPGCYASSQDCEKGSDKHNRDPKVKPVFMKMLSSSSPTTTKTAIISRPRMSHNIDIESCGSETLPPPTSALDQHEVDNSNSNNSSMVVTC